MTTKKIIGKLLVAFVLVSIGVAIGREIAPQPEPTAPEPRTKTAGTKVVVYYMHATPCKTCVFVEKTAETIVREDFAEQVKAGTMQFVSLNFLEPKNATLAEKYKVGGNMVIAVRYEDDKEVDSVRREDVLDLAREPELLKEYLRTGIREALEGCKQCTF